MALPEADVARVQAWCDARVPESVRDQMRIVCESDTRTVTILEERPPWDGPGDWSRMPVARLRYVAGRGEWSLYCVTGKGDFRRYDWVPPAPSVTPLLKEIERDPTAIFWG